MIIYFSSVVEIDMYFCFFTKPRDQVISKKEDSSRGTFSIVKVIGPIDITVPHKDSCGVMRVP